MSIGAEELATMTRTTVVGEVMDEDDTLDTPEELLEELRNTRNVLRRCLIMLYFMDTHVQRITKREHTLMGKQISEVEARLEAADDVIASCEE